MKPIFFLLLIFIIANLNAQSDFSSNYIISNFDEVNSYYDDLSCSWMEDSLYIIASTRGVKDANGVWKGNKEMELFEYDQNKFVPFPQNVNQVYSNGAVSIINSSHFYFTASNHSSKLNTATHLQTYHSFICEYQSEVDNSYRVQPIAVFMNDQYSYKDPSISKDGRFIYFSSDMPSGFGGFDLYMSFWEEGKWSTPINLGAGINTNKDETSPFYHQKSGRVFFTSDGHDTFGGTDIFFCFNQGDSWTKAVNIGNSINSSNNETSVYFDDQLQSGFVASDKKSGKGGYDIYKIERIED